jgi:hypothetical protein
MYDDKAYSPDTVAETKRDGEVSRQLKPLSHEIKDCLSRSGTLVERLAAIVSPRAEPSQLEADKPSGPTTPFAANLADLTAQLRQANRNLSLLLGGLELQWNQKPRRSKVPQFEFPGTNSICPSAKFTGVARPYTSTATLAICSSTFFTSPRRPVNGPSMTRTIWPLRTCQCFLIRPSTIRTACALPRTGKRHSASYRTGEILLLYWCRISTKTL